MKNVNIISKEDCCGCGGCYSVCARQAISMLADKQGFKYPVVDSDKCTDCGLCVKSCPSLSVENLNPISCHAVKHTDKKEQLAASSGGFASALSSWVINKGGSVYGVVYENVSEVVTVRIDSPTELDKLKGSKYVQTDTRNTFKKVYHDLKDGLMVVYFGTSCHVDGLKHYLDVKKCPRQNLITIDLICHGVPSPKLFDEYIQFLTRRKPVKEFSFRTKTIGWGGGSPMFCPTITYMDGEKEANTPLAKAYTQLFFSNNCLRPHCYQCPYAGKGRTGDFTIADYWGLKDAHPDFFDRDGVSLVLVNTQEGAKIFSEMDDIESIQSDNEKAFRKQINQTRPSAKSKDYDSFWKEYEAKGFTYVMYKYAEVNFLNKLRKKILRTLNIPF